MAPPVMSSFDEEDDDNTDVRSFFSTHAGAEMTLATMMDLDNEGNYGSFETGPHPHAHESGLENWGNTHGAGTHGMCHEVDAEIDAEAKFNLDNSQGMYDFDLDDFEALYGFEDGQTTVDTDPLSEDEDEDEAERTLPTPAPSPDESFGAETFDMIKEPGDIEMAEPEADTLTVVPTQATMAPAQLTVGPAPLTTAPVKLIVKPAQMIVIPEQQQLPSILQYVDGLLSLPAAHHDKPPWPEPNCAICGTRHAIMSTVFLPLHPCGHWVHYVCLIDRLIKIDNSSKHECPTCHIPLFHWDAINALTLAMRTGILGLTSDAWDSKLHYVDTFTGIYCNSDEEVYRSDCALIIQIIRHQYENQVQGIPKLAYRFEDGSMELAPVFLQTMNELFRLNKPNSRWLKYSGPMGNVLWAMFVMAKTRRILREDIKVHTPSMAWNVLVVETDSMQAECLSLVRTGVGRKWQVDATASGSDT